MISLKSLMDLLPYYFKEQDTYKVNGKGLLERYLDIFGTYFDDVIISDINTLDDIIDVDKTPELYLGYLWEFLGSMPYANPKAIDPEKWKQYFNGFNDDSTIENLSKLWVYRKDSDGDRYNLNIDQVRALVKYSVALFAIRGTKKFFDILLKLYGFDVEISNGSTYPKTTVVDDDDSDYWGTDEDYWGTDEDYGGSADSPFNIRTEATKLDSEWLYLDMDTTDSHTNCTRIVNVNFKLKGSIVYNTSSNEFKRLQDRMFNLINMFLPIGVRPHLIWDNVNVGNNYTNKVTRSIEVYVDRTPINWTSSDNVFVPSSKYPGWYRVYDRNPGTVQIRSFDWRPLKFMVKIEDSGTISTAISDQPKRFVVAFNGQDYSDTEYDDGHIFTLNPGQIFTLNPGVYYPKFKVSTICEEDFDLSSGSISTFKIGEWLKHFNYTLFKHVNPSSNNKYELSVNSDYISVLIQSASVRTYTNDANPGDDTFVPQQVINLTTGEYLTLCVNGTKLPNRQGNQIDYSQYAGRCIYVQHLFEPGLYEFIMKDRPEYKISIDVTLVGEVLTVTLVEGSRDNIIYGDDYYRSFIQSETNIDNPEWVRVITDFEDRILYGVRVDNTIYRPDLTGYSIDGVPLNSLISNLIGENTSVSLKLKVTSNLGFLGHEDTLLIKESSNPVSRSWSNEEVITLDDPGHYRFYGVNPSNKDAESNYVDVNVLSNKYNAHYYLELEDGDKSDDEQYMIRTLIPNRPASGSTVQWSFDFCITVDKSILEAEDIQTIDPNAFDLEVNLYRGGTPNRGTFLNSYTATVEVLEDDLHNPLPYYKVKGTISLAWNGAYNVTGNNRPPGLYCVELHDKDHPWPDTSSYRVVDAYVIPQKFDGNLYFDVDVISKAWTSPAGQIYDIDPITGKYTWGWFKTNEEYLHSVRLVRYDPAIDTPQFRLKLTNNTIGYTRVYMYKLVENGDEWDINAAYPKILPPTIKSSTSSSGIDNLHWLDEAISYDWGFPGEYNSSIGDWDYGKGTTGIPGYTGRWLFTGSVYQLGEIITGPQEPGKYLFLVNQLNVDTKVINYAYLEVKEEINYSLIVDPLLAILQGGAVGTTVNAISSAKFTKEVLKVRVINPDGIASEGYYYIPYAFYAYQPGTYTFELFKFEGGQYISLGLSANFRVLTDSGIYPEYLSWEWADTSDREVQVVTTSADVNWRVMVQNE